MKGNYKALNCCLSAYSVYLEDNLPPTIIWEEKKIYIYISCLAKFTLQTMLFVAIKKGQLNK